MKNILIKTKGKLKKQTVRNRYFVLLLSMSVLPLFLLGFISFQIAKNTLIQNQLKTTQEHLRTSSEVADLLLRNVVNMERLIAWNKEAAQELKRVLFREQINKLKYLMKTHQSNYGTCCPAI